MGGLFCDLELEYGQESGRGSRLAAEFNPCYRQRTGYWQPDGQGLQVFTPAEQAAALGLLAGGKEEPFIDTTTTTLTGQGDHALALHVIEAGLPSHPASAALADLRLAVLHRLMDADQQLVPFRFLIYGELAGAELGPIR